MSNYNEQYVQLLLSMRLLTLHREGFNGVTYEDLDCVFSKYILKHHVVKTLNQAADCILNVSTDIIIRYLALEATVRGKQQTLGDVLTGGDL